MADVFISFKHPEDRKKIEPLVQALRDQGWSVWWCADLVPGDLWHRLVQTEFDQASCIIVVWSARSPASDDVLTEATVGRKTKRLIQVTIEGVSYPTMFEGVQSADLTSWTGEISDPRFQELCAGVRRIIGPRPPPPPDVRGPSPTEARLANCVRRYYQEWLTDSRLKGRPPTMQEFLAPPKNVNVRIDLWRWVNNEYQKQFFLAHTELKKCMQELYNDYTGRPVGKGGVYPCILPVNNPDPEKSLAAKILLDIAVNLHRGFNPIAKSIRVEVRLVPGRETGTVKDEFIGGFGLVIPDRGGEDVRVDWSAVVEAKMGPLMKGTRVSFDREPDMDGSGPRAVYIRSVDQ